MKSTYAIDCITDKSCEGYHRYMKESLSSTNCELRMDLMEVAQMTQDQRDQYSKVEQHYLGNFKSNKRKQK